MNGNATDVAAFEKLQGELSSTREELQKTKAELEETKNSLADAKKLLSSKVERERALSCEDEATLKQQSSTPKQYAKVDDTEHEAMK